MLPHAAPLVNAGTAAWKLSTLIETMLLRLPSGPTMTPVGAGPIVTGMASRLVRKLYDQLQPWSRSSRSIRKAIIDLPGGTTRFAGCSPQFCRMFSQRVMTTASIVIGCLVLLRTYTARPPLSASITSHVESGTAGLPPWARTAPAPAPQARRASMVLRMVKELTAYLTLGRRLRSMDRPAPTP